MNCTDCSNTVPLSDGGHPRYVRPRPNLTTIPEPLCRICLEKATEQCQEHKRIPDPKGTSGCNGPLFTCPMCERRVCVRYRASRDDRCGTCVSEPEDD